MLLDILKKPTQVYDPSKNLVTIGGMDLIGVTDIKIDYPPTTRVIQGTSSKYNCFIRETIRPAKLTVSLLNTSPSAERLYQLHSYLRTNIGLFEVVVVKNGQVVLIASSSFESLPNDDIGTDAADLKFTFICDFTRNKDVSNSGARSLPIDLPTTLASTPL
jgi:hypothetical protein